MAHSWSVPRQVRLWFVHLPFMAHHQSIPSGIPIQGKLDVSLVGAGNYPILVSVIVKRGGLGISLVVSQVSPTTSYAGSRIAKVTSIAVAIPDFYHIICGRLQSGLLMQ
jgi:hypothetical protein